MSLIDNKKLDTATFGSKKLTHRNIARVLSISFLGVTISACTAPSEDSRRLSTMTPSSEAFVVKEDCCSNYADFYWLKLAKNDNAKLILNDTSPAWHFPQGQSYFGAFQFSDVSGQVQVNIKSLMLDGHVLAPKVMLLNSQFKPQPSNQTLEFKTLYSDALSVNRFEASFSVNAEETPYMVIYGDTSRIGKKITIPHPAKIRAMKTGEPVPMVSDISYLYSEQGNLEIAVETRSVRQRPLIKPVIQTKQSRVNAPTTPHRVKDPQPQNETVQFYHGAIRHAVKTNNIEKALALLEEAKSLGIPDAQRVFIESINKRSMP